VLCCSADALAALAQTPLTVPHNGGLDRRDVTGNVAVVEPAQLVERRDAAGEALDGGGHVRRGPPGNARDGAQVVAVQVHVLDLFWEGVFPDGFGGELERERDGVQPRIGAVGVQCELGRVQQVRVPAHQHGQGRELVCCQRQEEGVGRWRRDGGGCCGRDFGKRRLGRRPGSRARHGRRGRCGQGQARGQRFRRRRALSPRTHRENCGCPALIIKGGRVCQTLQAMPWPGGQGVECGQEGQVVADCLCE
jgi:hypothetical protein